MESNQAVLSASLTPKQAARSFSCNALKEGFVPVALYEWADSVGQIEFFVIRLERSRPDGTREKWIRPMHLASKEWCLSKPKVQGGFSPYKAHRLAEYQASPIWIVEGEKCVDALIQYGIPAVTSGGATSVDSVNWSILRDREVIIWPDNDDPGRQFANDLIHKLSGVASRIDQVDVSALGLSDKQDCVDWIALQGEINADAIRALPRLPSSAGIELSVAGDDRSPVVVDLYDLLTTEIPIRKKILPWMPAQSISMIHAWRGVGKTHVALGISYAIATGTSFLGWECEAPASVLYVDGEMPAITIQERLACIVATSEQEANRGMLRIITPDLQSHGLPDLATPEGQAALDLKVGNAEVIIVDNLSCLVRGRGKENDAESWILVQQWALKHRSEGRSIVFIHHSGKSGNQRGTSKKEDILDTVICLKSPSDYEHADGAVFEVHFEKARHIYGEQLKPFEARLTTSVDGHQTWTVKPVEDTNFDRVMSLWNQGLKQNDIADELGLNKSTVSRHCKKGQEQGLISSKRGREKTHRHFTDDNEAPW